MDDKTRIEQLEEQLAGLTGEYDKQTGDFSLAIEDRTQSGNALLAIQLQLMGLKAAVKPMSDMVDAMLRIVGRGLGESDPPAQQDRFAQQVPGLKPGVDVEEAGRQITKVVERRNKPRIGLKPQVDED